MGVPVVFPSKTPENFTLVGFLAGGHCRVQFGVAGGTVGVFRVRAGAAAVKFFLDYIFGKFNSGRASVNNNTESFTVAFTEGCNPEKCSEGISRHSYFPFSRFFRTSSALRLIRFQTEDNPIAFFAAVSVARASSRIRSVPS